MLNSLKQEILDRLSVVKSKSLIGLQIQEFCKEVRDTKEVIEMVNQIKYQIRDNSPMMIVQIGADNVVFFKNLKY